MKKIVKENGKIYLEKIIETYGVIHISRELIGTYEVKKPTKKDKKISR